MLTVICFLILSIWMMELQRQIREISEEVKRIHKDFLAEVYLRYGDNWDGEE